MKIFNATYCDCIYESSYGTISLHKTREGAELAIENHKLKEEAQYYETVKEFIDDDYYDEDYLNRHPYKPSRFEDYAIIEQELFD